MKFIATLLLMLLLAGGEWSLLIGSAPIEEALSISKMGSSYLVLVSSPYGSGENLTLSSVLVELTSKGEVEEMNRPLLRGDLSLTSVAYDKGRILAVGNIVNNGKMKGILIEESPKGWIAHTLNISGSNIQEIKPVGDGFLLAGGIVTKRGDWDILLVKLDHDLRIEWAIQVGNKGDNVVYDIATNGSEVYLLGPSPTGIMVIRLSLDGSIKWARSFSAEKYLKGHSIVVGKYIAVVGSVPYWIHKSDAFLLLLNNSGIPAKVEVLEGNGTNSLNDIAWDGKAYWAVGRTNCDTGGGCDAWVIQFSSHGSVKGSKRYGWKGIDGANALLIDGDREIIVGQSEGRNRESQFGDAFIMSLKGWSSCVPSGDRPVAVKTLKLKSTHLNLSKVHAEISFENRKLDVVRANLKARNPCGLDVEYISGIAFVMIIAAILIFLLYLLSKRLK